MRKIICGLFLAMGLMGCEPLHLPDKIVYAQDPNTDICFALYRAHGETESSSVPCTKKVLLRIRLQEAIAEIEE